MNIIQLTRYPLLIILITSIMLSCGEDEVTEPGILPIVDSRVKTINQMENGELVASSEINYDINDRIESIESKTTSGVVEQKLDCIYNGNDITMNLYELEGNELAMSNIIELKYGNGTDLLEYKSTSLNDLQEANYINFNTFIYQNGVLESFNYKIDAGANGSIDRETEGIIFRESDTIRYILEKLVITSGMSRDSTFFEYEDGKTSNIYLTEEQNGEFYLSRQSTINYENELFVSAYLQEFFTDFDNIPFTYPVSQATIDYYKYNSEDLLTKDFVLDVEYIYENGKGNLSDLFFYADTEILHFYILDILPLAQ